MHILKIVFVAVLCLPLLYIIILLVSNLIEQILNKK